MGFRFLTKSVTLDDLERRNGHVVVVVVVVVLIWVKAEPLYPHHK